MVQIAPSILAVAHKEIPEILAEVKKVETAGANVIHIDVMDGIFVDNKTIFLDVDITKQIKEVTQLPVDVHLMVQDPRQYVAQFIAAGADWISIHIEADGTKKELLEMIKQEGRRAGIVINPETPVAEVESLLDIVDFVLVMSVHPGKGGQSYIQAVNAKIARIKEINPKIVVEVDGGIKVENASLPLSVGADILVSGTGIFKTENYKETIEKMRGSKNE